MTYFRIAGFVVPGLALLLVAPDVRAQEAEGEAAADPGKESFDRGVKLFMEADYEGALVEFSDAWESGGDFKVLNNIGQCHARLGNHGLAIEYLQRFLEEGGDTIPMGQMQQIAQLIDGLAQKVSPLTFEISQDGSFVMLDGKVVGKSPLDRVLYPDPGPHTVLVQKEGFFEAQSSVMLVQGQPAHLTIDLVDKGTAAKLFVTSDISGTQVLVDGVVTGAAPWEGLLEPGAHDVTVVAAGHTDANAHLDLAAGDKKAVRMNPSPPAAPMWEAEGKKKPGKLHWGYLTGAGGLAVAGGIVALAVGVANKKHHDEFMDYRDDLAARDHVDESSMKKLQDYKDKGKGLNAGFATGFALMWVGIAASAVLFPFTDFKNKGVETQFTGSGASISVEF